MRCFFFYLFFYLWVSIIKILNFCKMLHKNKCRGTRPQMMVGIWFGVDNVVDGDNAAYMLHSKCQYIYMRVVSVWTGFDIRYAHSRGWIMQPPDWPQCWPNACLYEKYAARTAFVCVCVCARIHYGCSDAEIIFNAFTYIDRLNRGR